MAEKEDSQANYADYDKKYQEWELAEARARVSATATGPQSHLYAEAAREYAERRRQDMEKAASKL